MQPPDEEPPYAGPFVCIRPAGDFAWGVGIEPILPDGTGAPRTYGSKIEAFSAARELWTENRLPCRDETVGEAGRQASENRRAARGKG